MAYQIRRCGRLANGPFARVGGREPTAKKNVRRKAPQSRNYLGSHGKKVVKPSRRREMAQEAVRSGGLSDRQLQRFQTINAADSDRT